ncbi:S-adenosyl-L-methionine-dependent methyltransferase [Guyanagaster necrorhizus]|uniref:S-adenosyl-L-methionine-dependent methyltransferase n=1 Tax=Guyanagaster necrorhizus TaxID=856835 RepID=A0A9P7W2W3_9AGAR|nr:S-adenosyl-L-methionine-dependent methyltransferase [Guyanagaster necrorhizus MCA 3950]KAG7451652.1 S-adenosyl-L-methionine-dependent methyltransferase [Guyanagaster necrorhizus MCA 3950]
MPSSLKLLSNLIADSVDKIDQKCTAQNLPFPQLDDIFSFQSEAICNDADVVEAIHVITAAATQLIATARAPIMTLSVVAHQWDVPACLRVANDANVAEILRDVGPEGAHIDNIVKRNGMNAARLGRVLRLLVSHHIFREVSPDVFANNRISSLLDSGKPVQKLEKNPQAKYTETSPINTFVSWGTGEFFKGGAFLSQTLRDPVYGHSDEANQSALSKAFDFDVNFFEWLERPENTDVLSRFSLLMRATTDLLPNATILNGFDFSSLPDGALVVDVAGGIGSLSLVLAKTFSKLNVVVEERVQLVSDAEPYWKSNLPEALESGRVRLVAHDMFTPQPDLGSAVDVFVLRGILHDWADSYAIQILGHLRAAAKPQTKLVVIDIILESPCHVPDTKTIKGCKPRPVPEPLLANMGAANTMAYSMDVMMMTFGNGQERTLKNFVDIMDKTGWELKEVVSVGSWRPHLIAVPI